jgi:hypothetical protein
MTRENDVAQNVLSTCPAEAVLKVCNAQRRCKEEPWPPRQDTWPTGLTSGPPMTNLWPEHHLTPPIKTTVLPSTERVKKVRFSPPKGLPNSIFSRVEREVRFWEMEDFPACQESLE